MVRLYISSWASYSTVISAYPKGFFKRFRYLEQNTARLVKLKLPAPVGLAAEASSRQFAYFL
jgi:hypothetical protein